MQLIEPYLNAVGFWLPRKEKDDILEELAADLDAEIKEREAALGRAVSVDEIASMLQARGRPIVVANRFLPRQQLIGPVWFPIYRFVLKIICFGYLLPWALVWMGMMAFDRAYRLEQTRLGWGAAVASACSSLWTIALIAIGMATLVFIMLECAQARSHFLEDWDPRKLPPVRIPNQIPRSQSIFELAMLLLLCLWWAVYASSRVLHFRGAVTIELAPQWYWFFSANLIVFLVSAALAAFNLLHPYWTVRRAAFRVVSDCVGAGLFCWFLRAHIVTRFSAASLGREQSLAVTRAIDSWMGQAFLWAVVASVVIGATGVYRVVRVRRGGSSLLNRTLGREKGPQAI